MAMADGTAQAGPDEGAGERAGDPLGRWCAALDDAYPAAHAEGWDHVGLHVGDAARDTVRGVLVALDVTDAVLDEAADLGCDLLIAHHPLIFGSLGRLTPTTATGRLALRAARQGVAVLAAHTNVDKAVDGTSAPAADVLDLRDRQPIRPLPAPSAAPVKLVTFVPREATAAVVEALGRGGAGTIGGYDGCAFTSPGTGTFVPGHGTDPHVGTVGVREHVEEDRIEAVLPRAALATVVAELRAAHPYEEVPVDVYPLLDPPAPTTGPAAGAVVPRRGLGIIGTLPEPLPLPELARRLADGLPSPHLRVAAAGDPDAPVRTVAVCGGAGDSLIGDLLGPDGPVADVLVTGDLKHHPTLDALTMGLSLVDAGHFATEDPAMDAVRDRLEARRDAFGLTAPVHRSTTRTDPWLDWRSR